MIVENFENIMSTIYSGITSIGSFIVGLILGNINILLQIQTSVIEHRITIVLQWTAFIISILAGIITIYKAHQELKKRVKNKKDK